MMQNPMTAFINWFDSLPKNLRKSLAHIYRVCTTESTADIIMDPDQSLEKFKNAFVKPDFTLRVAARVFSVRAVFDMVLVSRDQISAMTDTLFSETDVENIVRLSDLQLEKVFTTWYQLRRQELSDQRLHAWASEMIKRGRTDNKKGC